MQWKKLGCVYSPVGDQPWMKTHAAVPTACRLEGNLYRVFFGARDAANRSHIGYVDFDISRPASVLQLSRTPILRPGDLGTFDDSGVQPSWICEAAGEMRLYYIGWNLGVTVPFRNALGLAIGNPDTLARAYVGPVLDRDIRDPFFVASACVLWDETRWRMWYTSCIRWAIVNDQPKHWYHIRHAESSDGIDWRERGYVCIDFKDDAEYAITRPCVIRDRSGYRMWYSYRGNRYRIGYAESPDGFRWERLDQIAGIGASHEGWDSEMVEYAYVFDHEGERYMLYNGNGYGRTGFGIAVLES